MTVEVPPEGVAAVMGHNGAGKTTLLRAAVGLLRPPIRADPAGGEDITQMRPNERVKRGLGYVPHGQQCLPQLTTEENLQLVADTPPRRQEADRRSARPVPALTALMPRRAGLLSGGQRQQLAIARALSPSRVC
ncbi:MAG TPA: ATP-binding cassette domain-containing protein [Pseudonocardiaceae bacterium]|nr:ATP-binding cassette domain-containing protein [Pseudonocardiaceae bacterium]